MLQLWLLLTAAQLENIAEILSASASRTKLPLCRSDAFLESDPLRLIFQQRVAEGKVS